uniref:Zgc:171501 n=1 Tax=Cyprinus carpio TaxID=7962 RepID=A0A8C1IMN1_CYPCA
MPPATTRLDNEQLTSLHLSLFLCLHNKMRLPLSTKLCYAEGGVPYQMTNIAMGFSLQIFLAVLSMSLAILAYIFLWFIPRNAMSSAFSVPWYLTISCFFETFMTVAGVEAFAMLMAAVIQDQACLNVDQTLDLPHMLSPLFAAVLFLGVEEQRGGSHMHTTYLNAVKKLIGHVSYQCLWGMSLFCTHVAGLGAQLQYLMLAILVSANISVPMWQMTLVRLGKKTALFIGLPLLMQALVVLVSMPEKFPVLAALFLLPWSMLSDVVDEIAVQNPSCKGLEPLFISGSRFCNKLGGGLSAGISTMTLHFTGYKAGACSHVDEIVLALKLLWAPIPVAFLLVGLVFFYLYPINKSHRKQIQQDLGNTRSNSDTLAGLEKQSFPIIHQITDSSQTFIFKTKTRRSKVTWV